MGLNTLYNKQRINNNRTIALEQTAAKTNSMGGGGLNALILYQTLIPDSVVVKAQNCFCSHRGFLTVAMYHHRKILHNKTRTKYRTTLNNGSTMNQQQQNHRLRTDSSLSQLHGGLKCIILVSNLHPKLCCC